MNQALANSPLKVYQQALSNNLIQEDAAQLSAIERLDSLHQSIMVSEQDAGLFRRILSRAFSRTEPEQMRGLYFWGGVGRGKTYLMDTFYECLPLQSKSRMHFHRFMKMVHVELRKLQGKPEPLVVLAEKLSRDMRLLCFDEFFVSDITDAMILSGLLEALFSRGVVLVATSNVKPDDLYENGLQRKMFLPAIELIKSNTEVINMDGGIDYRLRALELAEIYHFPLDGLADDVLYQAFQSIAPEKGRPGQSLEIEGRMISTRFMADGVAWFDFGELCDGPRSQNDYIELARIFHTILISNVPVMTGQMEDMARRFISLVDEFYDRNVKVIISAADSIENLYSGSRLSFEFQRSRSRLLEMQSHEYLSREHKP
jgi:cell division protein ZapE